MNNNNSPMAATSLTSLTSLYVYASSIGPQPADCASARTMWEGGRGQWLDVNQLRVDPSSIRPGTLVYLNFGKNQTTTVVQK